MSQNHRITEKQIAARREDLRRISESLKAAARLLRVLPPKTVQIERKEGGEPVTSVERAVNQLLWKMLLRPGEGWLSEESTDDLSRLDKSRVWVVDPLDGTREYIDGIPEWCISIGLVEEGHAVAGGIYNPVKEELFLGSLETNLTAKGHVTPARHHQRRKGIVVLASRSEVSRGEWERFRNAPFIVRPVGSVAYKLALVAAGFADATWTLVPKHEWDVAAGVALVLAAQGSVNTLQGIPPVFNRPEPRLEGLVAVSKNGQKRLRPCLILDAEGHESAGCVVDKCV